MLYFMFDAMVSVATCYGECGEAFFVLITVYPGILFRSFRYARFPTPLFLCRFPCFLVSSSGGV